MVIVNISMFIIAGAFLRSASRMETNRVATNPLILMRLCVLRFRVVIGLVILSCLPSKIALCETQVQTTPAPYATKYFLDAPPTKDDLASLPRQARDVVFARVRVINGPSWIGGRDQSGQPPPPQKYSLRAQIELLDILSGLATSGEKLDVFFLKSGAASARTITLSTPAMKARTYFVVIFLGEDDKHQLLGFSANQDEYDKWYAEWSTYERMRGRPGYRE